MGMKGMYELKDMLCKELDEITRKGELSAGSLDVVHKLTDTIKNIDKIVMMEEDGEAYSERRDNMGRYARDDGMGRMREPYDERGASYARRGTHYVRAHYSRDEGMGGGMRETRARYSRGDGKDHMLHELGEMMEDADEHERRILERAMQEIRKA